MCGCCGLRPSIAVTCDMFFLSFYFLLLVDSISDIMQASLESEKEKSDEWERKYNEAHESSEEKRKKLEETERRVHQLQDSLNR